MPYTDDIRRKHGLPPILHPDDKQWNEFARAFVQRFQQATELPIDSYAGPSTFAMLEHKLLILGLGSSLIRHNTNPFTELEEMLDTTGYASTYESATPAFIVERKGVDIKVVPGILFHVEVLNHSGGTFLVKTWVPNLERDPITRQYLYAYWKHY